MKEFKGFRGNIYIHHGIEGKKYALFFNGMYHLKLNINWLTELKEYIDNTLENIDKVNSMTNEFDEKTLNCVLGNSQPKKKVIKKKGFIYLMIDTANGYTKIGFSRNPKHRERTLQSEKPTIELIWKKEGTTKNEKELHEIFSHCRLRGEWFNLTRSDIELIKNYKFKN